MGEDQKAILLFSGGYDTLLATSYLVEKGFEVLLVTFDNGALRGLDTVEYSYKRLKTLFGDRVTFLGVESIVGTWRQFLIPYMLKRDIFDGRRYNFLPIEYFCITCRISMYIHAIAEGLLQGVSYLAEGARLSQGYPEQDKEVLERIRKFVEGYGLKLLLPVFNVSSKEMVKEELALRGIIPKTREPYCILSMPLYRYQFSQVGLREILELMDSFIIPRAGFLVDRVVEIKRVRRRGDLV